MFSVSGSGFLLRVSLFVALLVTAPIAFAQKAPILIKGTVLRANSTEPVLGASVLIVPGMTGKAADSLGRFRIMISPDDTLLIRSVGYKAKLWVPTSRTAAELSPVIYLEEDVEVMREVEVSGRPSDRKIRTALNNMKKPETSGAEHPNPKPIIPEGKPSRQIEAAPLQNPISYFSKQEREKRALQNVLQRVEAHERYKAEQEKKREYNKLFKDNRGYQ